MHQGFSQHCKTRQVYNLFQELCNKALGFLERCRKKGEKKINYQIDGNNLIYDLELPKVSLGTAKVTIFAA